MNFLSIVDKELKKYQSSTDHQLTFLLKNYPQSEESLKNIKRNYLFLDVQRLFIFNQKNYNQDLFSDLVKKFSNENFPDKNKIFSIYKKNPIEAVLLLYLFRLTKEIEENDFWDYIDLLLSKSSLHYFLFTFIFLADYDLHHRVLSKIENSFLKYFNIFFFKNLNINKLKTKMFIEYFSHGMVESCELLLNVNPQLRHADEILYLAAYTIHNQRNINKFKILSTIIDLNLANHLFVHFFDNNGIFDFKYQFEDREQENGLIIHDHYLKESLFYMYKKTFSLMIEKNIPIKEDLDILFKIYTYCYDLFVKEPEHNTLFIQYVQNLFEEKESYRNYRFEHSSSYQSFSYFLFLCIKQKINFYFPYILKQEINKESFFHSYFLKNIAYFSQVDYDFLLNYCEQNFIEQYFYVYYSQLTINSISIEEFENLFLKLYQFNKDLFFKFLEMDQHKSILDKIYSKIQIENF